MKKLMLLFTLLLVSGYAHAENEAFKSTAYPLPRFVSIGSGQVYVRSGPGSKYPVKWVLEKKGLPVEVVLEYDAWRKIKDIDGDEGWVHQSLLSGHRTGFVISDAEVGIHRKPDPDSKTLFMVEPKVMVQIESCTGTWCVIDISGYEGWIKQNLVWGVYPDEVFD